MAAPVEHFSTQTTAKLLIWLAEIEIEEAGGVFVTSAGAGDVSTGQRMIASTRTRKSKVWESLAYRNSQSDADAAGYTWPPPWKRTSVSVSTFRHRTLS